MLFTKTIKRMTIAAAIVATIPALAAAAGGNPDLYADSSKVVPVTELKFYQDKEGLTVARGDPASGAHSNYIKMPGGTASGVHTHTYSYYGVVIAGVVANELPGSKQDHPLPAGSYWYQKGGEQHVTKCISQTECIFFVTSKGAFDYLPAR